MAPTQDDLIGQVLDNRYEIIDRIGKGGMGSVYRAHQLNVERDVAVKVLSESVSNNTEAVARFKTEARIISDLRHPNTLKLLDVGELDDGRLYLVMEFLTGAPLNKILKSGPVEASQLIGWMTQVCASLSEAHKSGIVHRDLKPANLFIEKVHDQEIAKVLDFGIARLEHQPGVTQSGSIFGTPGYMSPEQINAQTVDGRSDVYSLGVLMYRCLTGTEVFKSKNPASLLFKHVQEKPKPFAKIEGCPEVPDALEALVMEMLEKDPAARPQSTDAVKSRLEHIDRHLRVAGDNVNYPTDPKLEIEPAPEVVAAPLATPMPTNPQPVPDTPSGSLEVAPETNKKLMVAALVFILLGAGIVGFAVVQKGKSGNEIKVQAIETSPRERQLAAEAKAKAKALEEKKRKERAEAEAKAKAESEAKAKAEAEAQAKAEAEKAEAERLAAKKAKKHKRPKVAKKPPTETKTDNQDKKTDPKDPPLGLIDVDLE